jgi:acyl-CoA reductase-like NAD-dependent aldehyde dehydrogenase
MSTAHQQTPEHSPAVIRFEAHARALQAGRPVRWQDDGDAARTAQIVLQALSCNEDAVLDALKGYTTTPHVRDEIQRSRFLLRSVIDDPSVFFGRVPMGAGFMPRNQLLYSLLYMGILPALCCERYVLRPPAAAGAYVARLIDLLSVKSSVPSLDLMTSGYREFVTQYLPNADFAVFTGSSETARRVRPSLGGGNLFIASGSGHNPILVRSDADLLDAAQRIVRLCLYNQGQDCSAPSAILCSETIAPDLVSAIETRLRQIRLADLELPEWERTVGPNTDAHHVRQVGGWLSEMAPYVAVGGHVHEPTRWVQPTILVKPLTQGPMYREWFSPVVMIQTYSTAAQVQRYIDAPPYRPQAMYLTKLGHDTGDDPRAAHLHPPDTVLENTDLHEYERGDRPYGGYGEDASYLQLGSARWSRPILAHHEVARYILCPRLRPQDVPSVRRSRFVQRARTRTATNRDLRSKYERLAPDEVAGEVVSIAGRIIAIRNDGLFLDLHDGTAKLQLRRERPPRGTRAPTARLGDIVTASGHMSRTQRGELTLKVEQLESIVVPTVRPERHAMRRLMDRMELLRTRSLILQALCETLRSHRFLEVRQNRPASVDILASGAPLRRWLARGLSDRLFQVHDQAHSDAADELDDSAAIDALVAYECVEDLLPLVDRALASALGCLRHDGRDHSRQFQRLLEGPDYAQTLWCGRRLAFVASQITHPDADGGLPPCALIHFDIGAVEQWCTSGAAPRSD